VLCRELTIDDQDTRPRKDATIVLYEIQRPFKTLETGCVEDVVELPLASDGIRFQLRSAAGITKLAGLGSEGTDARGPNPYTVTELRAVITGTAGLKAEPDA